VRGFLYAYVIDYLRAKGTASRTYEPDDGPPVPPGPAPVFRPQRWPQVVKNAAGGGNCVGGPAPPSHPLSPTESRGGWRRREGLEAAKKSATHAYRNPEHLREHCPRRQARPWPGPFLRGLVGTAAPAALPALGAHLPHVLLACACSMVCPIRDRPKRPDKSPPSLITSHLRRN